MSKPLINEISPGAVLYGTVKHVDQQKIDAFGTVSGGVGAIHLDPVFCKEHTRFGGTLVQGYLLLGYLTEMLKNNFGKLWVTGGSMEAKLVSPAMEGDTLVTGGIVKELDDEIAVCEIWLRNSEQKNIVVGTAKIKIK